MKVLFDTNVVLDFLMDRAPHADAAATLFAAVEHGDIAGYLGATTVTTIHYLAAKTLGQDRARLEIAKLLTLFEIAPITRPVLEGALEGSFSDFEDAVLYQAAIHVGAQTIVTRNAKDFSSAIIPVHTPIALVQILKTLTFPPRP